MVPDAGGGGIAASGSAGAAAVGGTAGFAGSAGTSGAAGASWKSAFPTFTKHEIASFSNGYMTFAADMDHDGKLDVGALSTGADGLVWFKNPSWKKYTITTSAKQLIFAAPYDVDGDGDLDVAIASEFDVNNTTSGGTISWAEAPADPTQPDWTLRKIDAIPSSHRMRWGDIDGDGKKELLVMPIFGTGSSAPSHAGAVHFTAYSIPASPKDAGATWKSQVLDSTHLEVSHDLEVVDWDGDKSADILTASNNGIYLFRPALGKGAEQLATGATGTAPDKGCSEVGLGYLGADRFMATIDPWHGTDAVVYTPGASADAQWSRQVLGSDFTHGHGFAIADFNGDGYDEIVAGGGQGAMNEYIYRYTPSSRSWEKIKLDSGAVAVSGMVVTDINGDGAPDILVVGTSPTNNLVWYENSK
jgi:hypothetical protein